MGILDNISSMMRGVFPSIGYHHQSADYASDDEDAGDEFPSSLRRELMPKHVAAIVDGNRRWAKEKGLSHVEGYQAGFAAMKKFLSVCVHWEIPIVSLFLFSSENWRRPKEEVDYLLQAFEDALRDGIPYFMRFQVRVSVIGNTSLLPISLQEQIKEAEEATKNDNKCHLLLAMSYGGQDDIVEACQRISAKVKDGSIKLEEISKDVLEKELQTKLTHSPFPDLLIRTSGEFRISNYYLWQLAYSELYFTSKLWPDFGRNDFIKALESYQKRGRRFGQN